MTAVNARLMPSAHAASGARPPALLADVHRTRALAPLAFALMLLALLIVTSSCGSTPAVSDAASAAATAQAAAATAGVAAQSGFSSAQTAVAGAPTFAAAAQTRVSSVQTALPGAQATAEAGATLAAAVLSNPGVLSARLIGAFLSGANVNLRTMPPDAAPESANEVTVDGADASGDFARLDPFAQQQAARVALLAAAELFPNAQITLTVHDPSGKSIVRGTKAPGADPNVTQ